MKESFAKYALRVMIFLLIASNSWGLYLLVSKPRKIAKIYKVLSLDIIKMMTIIPIITILGLLLIIFRKNAGMVMVALAFVCMVGIDLYCSVWPHAVMGTVSFILLAWFYFIDKREIESLRN